MLYTHFTKEEMDQIVDILERLSIKHKVEINEDLIEEQNERIKKLRYERYVTHKPMGRLFYSVRIEKEDFAKIPDKEKSELEKFNVFPELTEEIFRAETEKIIPIVPVVKIKRWEKLVSYLTLPALLYLLLEWLDRYVIPVWPD